MSRFFSKFVQTAALATGAIALASTSAFAGSLTGASVTGNVLKYSVIGNQTVSTPAADPQAVLNGGGNIELAADSEVGSGYGTLSTLKGTVDGKQIVFSSLQEADWDFGNPAGLANTWFNAALSANGINLGAARDTVFNLFKNNRGFQRTSDPNISAVSRDTYGTGDLSFNLVGHANLNTILQEAINALPTADNTRAIAQGIYNSTIGSKVLQASEVVKVQYDGVTRFLYSFAGVDSGLTAADDGRSHSYNYKVSIDLDPSKRSTTPEPTAMLGLAALAGVGALKRRRQA